MTEPSWRDLLDGVAGVRASFKSRVPHLHSIAARIRECSPELEHEAFLIDSHADELLRGLDALAKLADGMLEETAVMNVGDFAEEEP